MRIGMNKPAIRPARCSAARPARRQIDDVNARYHLDHNLLVQYLYWLKGMFTGDFGISVQQNTHRRQVPRAAGSDHDVPRLLLRSSLGLIIAVPLGRVPGVQARLELRRSGPTSCRSCSSSLPALVLAPFVDPPVRQQARVVPADRRQDLPVGRPRRSTSGTSSCRRRPDAAPGGDLDPAAARRHGRSPCRATSSRWPAPRACHPGASCGATACPTRCSPCSRRRPAARRHHRRRRRRRAVFAMKGMGRCWSLDPVEGPVRRPGDRRHHRRRGRAS